LSGDSVYLGWAQPHDTVTTGNFRAARAITIDPFGNVFVLDAATNQLLLYSSNGKLLSKTGGFGWGQTNFDSPSDVVTPNGVDVYVSDYGNHRIQRFDKQLNYVSSFELRSGENATYRLGYPLSVAVDRFGSLFVLEGENKQIVKISARQNIERIFGGVDAGLGRLNDPKILRVSENDRVYVLDDDKFRVFDLFGNYLFEVQNDSIHTIQSFAVRRDTLFVLQNGVLYILVGNTLIERFSVSEEVIDAEILNDTFVFLTKKNYYYVKRSSLIH
jgi:DNA-binding beta-propeller fold protein YncE